jgi:hypothetical protein
MRFLIHDRYEDRRIVKTNRATARPQTTLLKSLDEPRSGA